MAEYFSIGMAFTSFGFVVYFFALPYSSLSSWLAALAALIFIMIARAVDQQTKSGGV